MTALIYVAIVGVWVAVLVPKWLRRDDRLQSERSVDRLTAGVQSLTARPRGARRAASPRAASPGAANAAQGARAPGSSAGRAGRGSGQAQSVRSMRRARAATRRRVVLGFLTGSLLVVAGLVGAGVLGPIALAVPALLIIGFLGLARQQVRVANRGRAAREAARAGASSTVATPASARTGARLGGETWEPRATPLPTYVTASGAGSPRADEVGPAMVERAHQQKARKAEAIARARAEQAAAEARTRDEEYLDTAAVQWPPRRRAVNE